MFGSCSFAFRCDYPFITPITLCKWVVSLLEKANILNILNIEYKREGGKKLSMKNSFKEIRPFLCDIADDLTTFNQWKSKLRKDNVES